MQKLLVIATLLSGGLILSACENTEERTARLNQHNGKTVEQVMAVLGSPISRTREQAVWERFDSYVVYHPIHETIGNRIYTVGQEAQIVNQHCVFAAKLKNNRVVSSTLNGTGCYEMVPRLPGT